jgi:2-polyprenyl-3-methyl-5-hydroxy-6-metoxy-1,4-benzoquinol methylase
LFKLANLLNVEKQETHSDRYFKKQAYGYLYSYSIFKKHFHGGKIRDVGTYPGHFQYCLSQLGYDVYGIDLDPDRIPEAIRNVKFKVKKCDIEKDRFPFEDSFFDCVLFLEIIEHLRINPLHCLREISRKTKVGGCLILSTPNLFSLENRIRMVLGKETFENPYSLFNKLETLGHSGHIRLYSVNEITQLLQLNNFKVNAVYYTDPHRKIYQKRNRDGMFKKLNGCDSDFKQLFKKGNLWSIRIMKRAIYKLFPSVNSLFVIVATKERLLENASD